MKLAQPERIYSNPEIRNRRKVTLDPFGERQDFGLNHSGELFSRIGWPRLIVAKTGESGKADYVLQVTLSRSSAEKVQYMET